MFCTMTKEQIADLILNKLTVSKQSLKQQFANSAPKIGAFYLDNLLPEDLAHQIYAAFPSPLEMTHKKTLRESKYIAAQMDQYNPLLENTLYAFQDPRVLAEMRDICGIEDLSPDEHLYAGGISLMTEGGYLHPHLDNSHDKDRNLWRVLNVLYYVTPEWQLEYGGNLELWPEGVKNAQLTLESKFNRVIVMATHNKSWHSVSPIIANAKRCCISNYYFSGSPLKQADSFHVTTFRGRPESPVTDLVLQGDGVLRSAIRKLFPKGAYRVSHLYKRK